jgi:hypothetical protein
VEPHHIHNVQTLSQAKPASAGDQKLKKKEPMYFPLDYHHELDVTSKLTPVMANFYQMHIGVLRWCAELSRIDIMTEVSLLSSHLCLPRKGHLDAMYHLLKHLALNHNTHIV